MSGGRRWHGASEAEAMARWWVGDVQSCASAPQALILTEARSESTRENARQVAHLCRERGFEHVGLVTCDFHMKRALHHFSSEGLWVSAYPVPGTRSLASRMRLSIREWGALWLGIGMLLSLVACTPDTKKKAAREHPSTAASASAKAVALGRDPSEIDAPELGRLIRSTDTDSRRMLVRQLLGAPLARQWAAFGLGLRCESSEPKATVALLTSAVATWLAEEPPPSSELLSTAAWAIGACGVDESETILTSWLRPDTDVAWTALSRAAAEGLAAFADRRGRLTERTQSAVLSAAGREKDPWMLLPLGRVQGLSDAVGAHLLEVSADLLTREGAGSRRAAISALGRAGPSAAEPLGLVFLSSGYDGSERAAAAQALGQLGPRGQDVLDQVVADILSKGLPRRFDDPRWIPLRAALNELEKPARSAPLLSRVASAPLSKKEAGREAAAERRRLIWLRCRAEDLIARERFDAPGLLRCDPDSGRAFLLAQIRVLDRGKITAPGVARVEQLCGHEDPVVAEAALRLYAGHPELPRAKETLLVGLQSGVAGLRTTAAQIIATYPHRVFSKDSDALPADVIAALGATLGDEKWPLETQAATLRAAGASRALTLKPAVERLCASAHEALVSSAEAALSLLGSPNVRCAQSWVAPLVEVAAGPPVELIADTDIGPLSLRVDAPHAPASVVHFLRLVDAGFYNGLAIHAAREGFAVQLGDKNGDSYDDERSPGLPNELDPGPFPALSFGMGAFAAGAHDAQLFVLLADAPQLIGTRVRLGVAGGAWDQLVVGDVIHSLRRK